MHVNENRAYDARLRKVYAFCFPLTQLDAGGFLIEGVIAEAENSSHKA